MKIVFSDQFRKEYKKIKDNAMRLRIIKAFKALAEMPEKGKHLGNILHGKRSIRIKPFRLIYEIKSNELHVLCFDHRNHVYENVKD